MKVKFKLDKVALKDFAIHHVEKIVFSLVVVCFLLFVYSAVNGEVWTSKPEDLSSVAKAAVKRIGDTPAEKGIRVVPNVLGMVMRDFRPISNQWYQWVAPIFPLPHKQAVRERPEVMPLEKLQASAGSGAFNMRDLRPGPGQGVSRRGQRWVVITGLLPFAKQRDAYIEALKGLDPRNPSNPMPGQTEPPVWVYYYVERAEVTSADQPVESLKWTDLHARRALFVMRRWQSASPEVVPSQFIHSFGRFPMAFPLGPLANATWGAEVVHEPEIAIPSRQTGYGPETSAVGPDGRPLPKGAKSKAEKEKEAAVKAYEAKQKAAFDKFLEGEATVPNAPPAMDEALPDFNALPGMTQPGGYPPGMMAPGMMAPGMMAPGMMAPGMMPEGMMGAGMPYGMGAEVPGMGMPGQAGEIVPYQLFRFFDFTVEPSKRYRYRVRLELRNPNYKVDTQFLADEKEKSIETLKSEWSAPSDAVFVARDARVLAGPVNMPRDPLSEPWATFGVVRFDMDSGETLFKEFPNDDVSVPKMFRGQIANFVNLPKPAIRGMPQQGESKMDFLSDYVLLDMNGGTKLPGKAKLLEPGRTLWLDPAGKLIVRNDVDDEEEFAQFKETEKAATPAVPGVPGMPGMPPGMMPEAMPPGMMPGMAPGMMPGMAPGMMPGMMPGMPPGMTPEMMAPGMMPPGMDIMQMPGAGRAKPGAKTKRKRPTE